MVSISCKHKSFKGKKRNGKILRRFPPAFHFSSRSSHLLQKILGVTISQTNGVSSGCPPGSVTQRCGGGPDGAGRSPSPSASAVPGAVRGAVGTFATLLAFLARHVTARPRHSTLPPPPPPLPPHTSGGRGLGRRGGNDRWG